MKISFLCVHTTANFSGLPRWRFSLAASYLQAYLTRSPHYSRLHFTHLNFFEVTAAEIIVEQVVTCQPDLLAIPCYAWNRSLVIELLPLLKSRLPTMQVVLGGPEFGHDATTLLPQFAGADYIAIGEGERIFLELVEHLLMGTPTLPIGIHGLVFRDAAGQVIATPPRAMITKIDEIPSPFLLGIVEPAAMAGGMAAMETQRGCVMQCAYCHYPKGSNKIRLFGLRRVLEELETILACRPKQLYLMDPTFNANKRRAKVILRSIIEICQRIGHKPAINTEMIPEMLDEELIFLCQEAGINLLEVGIQSFNPETLHLMGRFRNESKLLENIGIAVEKGLRVMPSIIYGLPGDTLADFFNSFDRVFDIPSREMDLFPLMVLPGTRYRLDAAKYGLLYEEEPPYRVRCTQWIDEKDIGLLHRFTLLVPITFPMKETLTAIHHQAGVPHHLPFWQFVQAEGDNLDFRWPLRDNTDRKTAYQILDRFMLFLQHGIFADIPEEEVAHFRTALELGTKRCKMILLGHLASNRSLQQTKQI